MRRGIPPSFAPRARLGSALVAGAVALGCARAEPPPAREREHVRRDEPELAEPISLRRGPRELLVRCALSCEGARGELVRQREACIGDPTSTPHAVGGTPALVALGCCVEAEGAYREACGIEGLESCVSRWSAECASGRLTP